MVGTHLLPPNLLKLFAPRPTLPYLKPLGRDPDFPLKSRTTRKPKPICISETLARVREEREEQEAKEVELGKQVGDEIGEVHLMTGEESRLARIESKKRVREEIVEAGITDYNPAEDEEIVGDPYRTLFIGRLPYSCTDLELRREFESYGPLERVRIVRDTEGKSRGYGFLVFEREKDMKTAYKDAEGLKMMNRRLLIDVERGRTVKGWKPRRLGGGLGGRPKPVAAPPADTFTATNYAAPRGGGNSFPMRGGRTGGQGFVQRGGYGGNNNFNGGNFNDRGGNNGGNFGGNDRGGYGNSNGGNFNRNDRGPPGGGGNFGGDRVGYGGDRGGRGGYGGDRGGFQQNQNRGYGGNQQFSQQGPSDNGYGPRGIKREGGGFQDGGQQQQRPRY